MSIDIEEIDIGRIHPMIPDYINTSKSLIEAGADIDAKNINGTTPLMITSCPKITKLLIEAGADVNAKDKNGYTALMLAAKSGNIEKVNILVEAGADVNAVGFDGSTALSLSEAGVEETPEDKPQSIHKDFGG